jgi:hypothetical protein
MPFATNLKRYEIELSKGGSIINIIVDLFANNSNCSLEESAQCILKAFCNKFENSFVDKMDVISTKTMLSEADITVESSRISFQHINQFFARKMFTSEKKQMECFTDNNFKPTCKQKFLEDKTLVRFWFKSPDELARQQIQQMITDQDLSEVQSVHFTVVGDHGRGKFRMTLKFCFTFPWNLLFRLFQIACVEYSKDSTLVLKSTVLDPIGESLNRMVEGGRFIVTKGEEDGLMVQFSSSPEGNITTQVCNVPSTIVAVGDLKFYAQLLSGSWCMWCDTHPSPWNDDVSSNGESLLWTIQRLKEVKDKITHGELTQAKVNGRAPNLGLHWAMQLHATTLKHRKWSNQQLLDNLYDFIEDQ